MGHRLLGAHAPEFERAARLRQLVHIDGLEHTLNVGALAWRGAGSGGYSRPSAPSAPACGPHLVPLRALRPFACRGACGPAPAQCACGRRARSRRTPLGWALPSAARAGRRPKCTPPRRCGRGGSAPRAPGPRPQGTGCWSAGGARVGRGGFGWDKGACAFHAGRGARRARGAGCCGASAPAPHGDAHPASIFSARASEVVAAACSSVAVAIVPVSR
jgi:hypothetical protein